MYKDRPNAKKMTRGKKDIRQGAYWLKQRPQLESHQARSQKSRQETAVNTGPKQFWASLQKRGITSKRSLEGKTGPTGNLAGAQGGHSIPSESKMSSEQQQRGSKNI